MAFRRRTVVLVAQAFLALRQFLLRQAAGGVVAGANFLHRRVRVLQAPVTAIFAPRVERAVLRPLRRHRRQTVNRNQDAVFRIIQAGNGAEQRAGVRVLGVVENLLAGGCFHHMPAVHDVDAFRIARHQPQIVRHHDDGSVGFLRNLANHLQQLRLRGHVQRGGCFVSNQNIGVRRHRHSNHDALAHTAGELLRVIVVAGFRVGDVDHLHGLNRALLRFRGRQLRVQQHVFLNLITHRQHGVEAGHWLLKNHGDSAAAHLPHRFAFLAVGKQVALDALQIDLAARYSAGACNQLEHREHRHRFTGAGFAHDADNFAAVNVQVDALDCVKLFSFVPEGRHKSLDGQQMCHFRCSFRFDYTSPRRRGSSASRTPSPSVFRQITSRAIAMPGARE